MIDENDKYIDETISTIDSSLLNAAKQGNNEAWQRIYYVYGRLVYVWIRCHKVPETDSADIRQIVFEALHRNISNFQRETESDTFRGWLRKITKHKVFDYWRRLGRIPKTAETSEIEYWLNRASVGEYSDGEPSLDESSLDLSDKDEKVEILRRIMDFVKVNVNDEHWHVFIKVVNGTMSREEIATEHNIRRTNVDVIYSRVTAKLRREFADFPGEDTGNKTGS